ncbi:hypothetical protein JHK82_023690 [Glycine max]|nr:hypothetical protein JHK85_024253 [Glycine max]KAG5011498.1 hypothetical protein JHK86_023759 [Glycine max]KAG5132502.1 hypothetical protein JHK82_023690 [Glycine max]KAH1040947.1 hypothetical protein GYH30_023686 [Glycine max]
MANYSISKHNTNEISKLSNKKDYLQLIKSHKGNENKIKLVQPRPQNCRITSRHNKAIQSRKMVMVIVIIIGRWLYCDSDRQMKKVGSTLAIKKVSFEHSILAKANKNIIVSVGTQNQESDPFECSMEEKGL